MPDPRLAPRRAQWTRRAPPLIALLVLCLAPACRHPPVGQKSQVGPFAVDRYAEKTAAGERLDCFLFGAQSNKPVRLCGQGNLTPGYQAVLFTAQSPPPASSFVTAVGEPLPEGLYLLRASGATLVDAWPLGHMAVREWLAGGKVLLGVEVTADRHTHVRLIEPQARSERTFDVGATRGGDNFLLVRAPLDAAVLLVQKFGGDELLLVRDPTGNAEVAVGDASDERSVGNRKFHARGEGARRNGGQYLPGAADLAAITWKRDAPQCEGAPMGPFEVPTQLR